jgi:phospholipid/cholesterol/gamma-HCH transport system substrate-binding protein
MIFGKTKLELKVGIFVFLGLVILVTFVLLIGDFKTWTSGFQVNFIFNFVNGVRVGAPVRFAGVDIGQVKAIKFIFLPGEQKTQVQVVGWLKKEINMPSDSTVWVNTLGLLGEKYIEIMPGKDYAKLLTSNQSLVGTDPIPMHEVTQLAKNIVDHLDESIVKIKNKEGTIGKLLYDDAIYKELEALIIDIRKHPWKLFWKTKEKK